MFRDLTEAESFSKAARMNGVTPAAVSLQISALEKRLDSLLVERSRKKFRLTREGHPRCCILEGNISSGEPSEIGLVHVT